MGLDGECRWEKERRGRENLGEKIERKEIYLENKQI
jgi:hypothetical protein